MSFGSSTNESPTHEVIQNSFEPLTGIPQRMITDSAVPEHGSALPEIVLERAVSTGVHASIGEEPAASLVTVIDIAPNQRKDQSLVFNRGQKREIHVCFEQFTKGVCSDSSCPFRHDTEDERRSHRIDTAFRPGCPSFVRPCHNPQDKTVSEAIYHYCPDGACCDFAHIAPDQVIDFECSIPKLDRLPFQHLRLQIPQRRDANSGLNNVYH